MTHADNVPLLISSTRTPAVIGRSACRRTSPAANVRDEPTKTQLPSATREDCRAPMSQGAFHRRNREEIFSSRVGLLAHAAHTLSPWLGKRCFLGIASVLGPPHLVWRGVWEFDQDTRERRRLLNRLFRSFAIFRAWT